MENPTAVKHVNWRSTPSTVAGNRFNKQMYTNAVPLFGQSLTTISPLSRSDVFTSAEMLVVLQPQELGDLQRGLEQALKSVSSIWKSLANLWFIRSFWMYPLVMTMVILVVKPSLMCISTISMVIFHSYVSHYQRVMRCDAMRHPTNDLGKFNHDLIVLPSPGNHGW